MPASVDATTAEWYQGGNALCFASECPDVTVNYTGPPMSRRAGIAAVHEHLVARGYRPAFDWGWSCGWLQYDGDSFTTNECGNTYRHRGIVIRCRSTCSGNPSRPSSSSPRASPSPGVAVVA